MERRSEGGEEGAEGGADNENKRTGSDRKDTRGDETTDGEDDEGVGEERRGLGVGVSSVLDGVVDEESTDGDLGGDVEPLGGETENGSDLLVEGLGKLSLGGLAQVVGGLLKVGLGNLREVDEVKGDDEEGCPGCDGEVDVLDVGEVVAVAGSEEELGGDEGTDERGETVPRLRELESEGGRSDGGHDRHVRVGGDLKGSKTASDDWR